MSEGSHLLHNRIIALTGDAVHSKKRLFECAAAAISAAFELDGAAVYKALLGREKLGTTPHITGNQVSEVQSKRKAKRQSCVC